MPPIFQFMNLTKLFFSPYRIAELVINKIAYYEEGNYYAEENVDSFIWDRRRDLRGMELRVLAVESVPFTSFVNNVSVF